MILDKIIKNKKREIALAKKNLSLEVLKLEVAALPAYASQFLKILRKSRDVAVIAEIKKRSPSKGLLRKNFKPAEIAVLFEKAGASALSVLTDAKFFGGSPEILEAVRAHTRLPILRKDFILDEYQVLESRLIGADAILLIAAILSQKKLKSLSSLAQKMGLDVLWEAHSKADIKKIRPLSPKIIGINNRDLRTFRVDLETTSKLAGGIPKNAILVSESGIQSRSDVLRLKKSGVKAILVGESLMRQQNVGFGLKKLLGKT